VSKITFKLTLKSIGEDRNTAVRASDIRHVQDTSIYTR
jgi:hypothetical protein